MQNISPVVDKVETKLKYWARQLHDMSGRNRLLFWKVTKSSSAIIEKPDFADLFELLVEKGEEVLAPIPEATIKGAKTFFDLLDRETNDTAEEEKKPKRKLKPNEIQTNHSISALNKVLYNLRYTSRTIQEEQGFNTLYITFGMLKWQETPGSDSSYAPLVLVPVQIERESAVSPYLIQMAEDDIVVNPVLETKLLNDFGLQLPGVTNEITKDQLFEFLKNVSQLVAGNDGWEVIFQTTIGAFNFLNLLLIKDFETNKELFKLHPFIQILSGVDSVPLPEITGVPEAKDLDDSVDPETVYEIMDADSSQQEAIEAAKRGVSFVLQGPPGTGKSQTIANIIAESLMAGKKVLFVSQKMAALEVVQNRLNHKGLGDFCLEVHSHKMDKRQVIIRLMRSLSNTQLPAPSQEYKLQSQELKQVRIKLNSYIRQLHEPRFDLGISLYKAQGHLAKHMDAPQLNFVLTGLTTLSTTQFSKLQSVVRELASYSQIIEANTHHRWWGYKELTSSLQNREELAEKLKQIAHWISDFHERMCAIAGFYQLPAPEFLSDSIELFDILVWFKPIIFSEPLQKPASRFIKNHDSFARFVDIQFWNAFMKLRAASRQKTLPSGDETASLLKNVQKIYNKIDPGKVSDEDYDKPVDSLKELKQLKQRIILGLKDTEALFDSVDLPLVLKSRSTQPSSDLVYWFADHSENVSELAEWTNFNSARKQASDSGLGDFLSKAFENKIPAQLWEEAFLRRFYLLISEQIIQDRPILQKFRGTQQSEMIERFRSLDLSLIENTPKEIQAKLLANKPQASWIQAGSAETAILRREFNKKRRIMPLRKLFFEISNLIQALKPCLMMSPLTVSQLLDPNLYKFDLVVFDEASQIPPEYAMGAFLRGKQVIVAGDRQQLPPTNFFQTIESDEFEDDNDQFEEASFESILNSFDSCGFPSKMLNWHYRSKDETLIAYSNYHFYDNRLFTFPNVASGDSATGLKFIFVPDGVYKKGVGARHNLVEASKVAELVYEHLSNTPELSLGIVAFSMSQRRAIEVELDNLRKSHPELNPLFSNDINEPIFIKNLENVQGDERDVIILSVGYGKDETGKMTMNFGPINREGGARRLNVAVTRARYSLKVVASIQPEDIDLSHVNSLGATLLRNYLEVARDGVKAVYKDEKLASDAEFDSPFEANVYQELSRRGLQLKPQVGVSSYRIDFAVVDPDQPGRFLLGIECDGAAYHSAFTARDRDRLRQQILEGLGWKIHRIWSRDWIQNREAEILKVLAVVDSRKRNLTDQGLSSKKKVGA
jgi:very-short-patch-repair endonuclease